MVPQTSVSLRPDSMTLIRFLGCRRVAREPALAVSNMATPSLLSWFRRLRPALHQPVTRSLKTTPTYEMLD